MPCRDAFQRALHDVVDDRLLERVVVDRPREEPPLAVARRGREIELRGEPSGELFVEPADDLVPFAVLIMRVVALRR